MPKFAILSDIHSNADALEVVLAKCAELGITDFISLGDIVGYNAEPARCIEMVKQLNFVAMVRGNHDDYTASGNTEMSGFNPNAKAAINWTRKQLSAAERAWLVSVPYIATLPKFGVTVVHATLDTPDTWGYVFDAHHAGDNFSYQRTALCFCGHSHVPVAFCKKPLSSRNERMIDSIPEWNYSAVDPAADTDFNRADELPVNYIRGGVHKYLFNIGSIGQPRNGDPRASFAVLDTDKCVVTRYRLPYDIASAQQKVLAAGLPERLARRLAAGN